MRRMLCLLLLFLVACGTTEEGPTGPWVLDEGESERLFRTLDPSPDVALGNLFYAPALRKRLEAIWPVLQKQSRATEGTVRILNSSDVAVYLYPGGHVRPTRGLLALCRDEADAAAALALGLALHERKVAERTVPLQEEAVEALLDGYDPDAFLEIVEVYRRPTYQNELTAADARAIEILEGAGYDPNGLARLLEAMMKASSPWLEALPATDERLKAVRTLLKEKGESEGTTNTEDWFDIHGDLKATQAAYDRYDEGMSAFENQEYKKARRLFEEAKNYDDRQTPFLVALGRCEMGLGDYSSAEAAFIAAVSVDESIHTRLKQKSSGPIVTARFFDSRYYAGEFYLSQQVFGKAERYLGYAVRYYSRDPRPHLRLGTLAEAQRLKQRAIKHYRKSLALSPSGSAAGQEAKSRLEALQ